MATTIKQISLALSKEDLRMLTEIMERYGENRSVVIKKAILMLYSNLNLAAS